MGRATRRRSAGYCLGPPVRSRFNLPPTSARGRTRRIIPSRSRRNVARIAVGRIHVVMSRRANIGRDRANRTTAREGLQSGNWPVTGSWNIPSTRIRRFSAGTRIVSRRVARRCHRAATVIRVVPVVRLVRICVHCGE